MMSVALLDLVYLILEFGNMFCKFLYSDGVPGFEGEGGLYYDKGGVGCDDFGIEENKDIFLSVVYEISESGDMDEICLYYDGLIRGACEYPKDLYVASLNILNDDSMPFYVGYCPFGLEKVPNGVFCGNGVEYFLKGQVYSIRLYSSSLNSEEVKLNYDMTLKYRDSFKDEKF